MLSMQACRSYEETEDGSPPDGASNRTSLSRSSMNSQMHRRKLLILANDRALRRELETIFADLDMVCSEAGEQTLAVVRRFEPDVVLFDLGAAREPAVAAQGLELLRQ